MTVLNFLNEDVEKVYVRMSDADYDKLEGTVRAFKRDKFKNDPEYRKHVLEARKKRLQAQQEELNAAALLPKGTRVKVNSSQKVGTVRFLGPINGETGLWVGVELDQPVGNCAGDYDKVQYFECPKGCGLFLKPTEVEAGDWPIDDGLGSDSSEL